MRRIAFLSLALISLTSGAEPATRPHYGGTLRVAMETAPATLDLPPISSPVEYRDIARVLSLVGNNLVRVDAHGQMQPDLAIAWQDDPAGRRWQFTLRPGARFHDGSAASASSVAQILSALHPDWNLSQAGSTVIIDTGVPALSLPAELALPRNLILTRSTGGIPIGTGPFRIVDFQPGRLLKLAANEDSWAGRPFLDAIEIEFGKSLRDQAVTFELGRADVIEAAPQAQSAGPRARTSSSLPMDLLALVFTPNSKATDPRVRQALALSIDRKPIQSALLKGAAEPTATILPNWMTGYSLAFSTQPNIQHARSLLAESRQPPLTLSYNPQDSQAQLIAERVALNAREAGITVQVSLSGSDDIRLVRIAAPSPDPALCLREMAHPLGLVPAALDGTAPEDLFQAERSLLAGNAVIPLFHLPTASLASARVHGWAPDQLGSWNLADLWVENTASANAALANQATENSR